jgi:hypothetical protein
MTITSWWDSSATFKQCTLEKVSFVALNIVDLGLTLLAMHLGFDELNPLVNFMLDMPVLMVLVKLVLPVGIAWLMPGRLLWPSIGLLGLVAIWNLVELITFFV